MDAADVAQISAIDQVMLRLAYIAFISGAVAEADRETRSAARDLMRKGDSLTCWSPLDATKKLLRTSMSNPKPVARVVDEAALDEWIRETYPDKVDTRETVVGTEAEVVKVLRKHAPRLLAKQTVVPGWAVNELLTRSKGAGEPVGFGGECGEDAPPGIEVTVPAGVLSVTVDKTTGPKAFRELWDAHMFGMDGTVISLPGGGSDDTESA